ACRPAAMPRQAPTPSAASNTSSSPPVVGRWGRSRATRTWHSRSPTDTPTTMNLREVLTGAVVMGPMTKGSKLPYRRLAAELGARVLVSEMAVARRLKQKRKSEFALIRRFPGEPCFGVQLAGTNPDE